MSRYEKRELVAEALEASLDELVLGRPPASPQTC
jgi:hypothetical protein